MNGLLYNSLMKLLVPLDPALKSGTLRCMHSNFTMKFITEKQHVSMNKQTLS